MFCDLTERKIIEIIEENKLTKISNLLKYIEKNPLLLDNIEMYQLASYANDLRKGEKPSYIETNLLNSIRKNLPSLNKRTLEISDPSCGVGIFLPILLQRYENTKSVINFTFIDNDKETIEIARALSRMMVLKRGRNVSFKVGEFLRKRTLKADLLISNFPNYRTSYTNLRKQFPGLSKDLPGVQSISTLYLKKALVFAKNIVTILPKAFLFSNEFKKHRAHISRRHINAIVDLDTKGFINQQSENIVLFAQVDKKIDLSNNVEIYNVKQEKSHLINQRFMTSSTYPNWILYRNTFFNAIAKTMIFDTFKVSKHNNIENTSKQKANYKWLIQPFNINEKNQLITTENDTYFSQEEIKPNTNIAKTIDKETYILNVLNNRFQVIKKPIGSAISDKMYQLEFEPSEENLKVLAKHLNYLNSEEFFEFYQLATNYSSKSTAIDSNTIFFFGLKEEENVNKTNSFTQNIKLEDELQEQENIDIKKYDEEDFNEDDFRDDEEFDENETEF
ncbi:DNA methyltransferase [Mycoplasmopsis hyopharyngis]|uniref:DNA methyltransferase n=1 Tax=Mycoplasmopsis hyopharyngis TaxID=29558 RepID=UPI0038734818